MAEAAEILQNGLELIQELLNDIKQLPLKERTKASNVQAITSIVRALATVVRLEEDMQPDDTQDVSAELEKLGYTVISKRIKDTKEAAKEEALKNMERINSK